MFLDENCNTVAISLTICACICLHFTDVKLRYSNSKAKKVVLGFYVEFELIVTSILRYPCSKMYVQSTYFHALHFCKLNANH